MSGSNSDRNLLFGILALQMDFISRDALIAAMNAWVLDKDKPLGQILADQGELDREHLSLLDAMVEAHVRAHHNDPQQSLAALSSVSSVRDQLVSIADDQLQESLLGVGVNAMCDRFEEAWKTGKRPAIEDYLGEVTGQERAFLLCELAAVDFDYRRLAGETPSVEEYCARFPSLDTARLARLLARHAPADPYATKVVDGTSRPGPGLRYRILRPHARGGLGEVFVALDQELHREVALKEIQEERAHDTVSRSRFLLEAEITGGLEHPGIVPVYGLGQYSDGRPFYAMRFIKGDNLKEAIRRFHDAEKPGRDPGERSLALRDLLRRFVDVCNAVAYAHSRGVLHRDLKPGNIMLGKYGETLIVDWGLAKSVGRSDQTRVTEEITFQPSSGSDWAATVMGTVIGTPAYMSPEQAAGRLDLLGPASDIYSLGATLYALLTGTAPFDESDKGELLQQVQRGAWRPPRQVKAHTPPALDAICRKAMALQPQDRYVTALDLAADVEHWLADEPVTAYPEPWSVRTSRWLRRHRPLVAGASALWLAAGPLSVVIVMQAESNKLETAVQIALTNRKVKLGFDHPEILIRMCTLAECLVKLERGAEAVPIIDDCLRRASGTGFVQPSLYLRLIPLRLRHFQKTKDPSGCRQTAEMWEKLNRTDAGSLYDAACMRAVTAAVLGTKQAGAEAEQAMAWLKQAVAAGYKNAAHMEKDKDLDALRDREDFKKLLAELAAGAAGTAKEK